MQHDFICIWFVFTFLLLCSFRGAFKAVFPEVEFGHCWPHISRKFAEGEYCSKNWEHFEEMQEHLHIIHNTSTAAMRDLLMQEIGKVWDSPTWKSQCTTTFWNSNCLSPWKDWHLGCFQAPACTPSQQTQESWHRQLQSTIIPNMTHQSTEHMFSKLLPRLILMDAIRIPNKLTFDIQGPCFPKEFAQHALTYIIRQDTHVFQEEGKFYFLRVENPMGLRKLEARHVEMYKAARQGIKHKRIKDLDHLLELCESFHVLEPATEKYGHVQCEANRLELICSCDRGKLYGICPHILAANHICKQYNVRAQLQDLGARTVSTASKPTPALTKARTKPTANIEYGVHLGVQGR